jgi:hypothetical protein
MVMVVPMAAAAAAVAGPASAEEPINTDDRCRECAGIGITPCKCLESKKQKPAVPIPSSLQGHRMYWIYLRATPALSNACIAAAHAYEAHPKHLQLRFDYSTPMMVLATSHRSYADCSSRL